MICEFDSQATLDLISEGTSNMHPFLPFGKTFFFLNDKIYYIYKGLKSKDYTKKRKEKHPKPPKKNHRRNP